jgi:hypothetical protein
MKYMGRYSENHYLSCNCTGSHHVYDTVDDDAMTTITLRGFALPRKSSPAPSRHSYSHITRSLGAQKVVKRILHKQWAACGCTVAQLLPAHPASALDLLQLLPCSKIQADTQRKSEN